MHCSRCTLHNPRELPQACVRPRVLICSLTHALSASMGAELVPQVRGSWIGNIDVLRRRVRALTDDYLPQHTADLFDEYNSKIVNFRVLWGDHFITSDEGHVKHMLTGEGFQHFPKGYWWQERFESFLGNGIFNRDGVEWQMHRQIARPWFSRERISDFNIFDKYASTTLDHITRFSASQSPFDFQDLAGRFTIDSASDFLFDSCVNALHGALPVAGKARVGPKGSTSDDDLGSFAWAFENIQMQVARRMMVGNVWPLFELRHDRTKESNKVVHGWVAPVVELALREKAAKTNSKRSETFLGHLVDSTDNAEDIRNQVLNMLLAGRDTTAALLTFTVYLLSIHPDVMDRLRAEITSEYGVKGQPAPDSMRKLVYRLY
ncbi:cytochrome P450 [Amylostereum chailletii]|nr:cytochrome P450 [Amylostereum chailletii]